MWNSGKMFRMETGQSRILFIMQNSIRIYIDTHVILRIYASTKPQTCKERVPARKNPASLTGMKEAENAATQNNYVSADSPD